MTDERPKPKYGELAPEGWVWQPPNQAAPDADEPSASPEPAPAAAVAPTAGKVQSPAPGPGPATASTDAVQKPLATGDLIATVALLVMGLFATVNTVTGLLDLPAIFEQALSIQGLDVTYTATAAAGLIGTIGGVVLVLLYAAAVWLSIKALRARRTAFYIPLAIALLSFMLVVFLLILAFFADGGIMNALLDASQR